MPNAGGGPGQLGQSWGPVPNQPGSPYACRGHRCGNCNCVVAGRYSQSDYGGCNNFNRRICAENSHFECNQRILSTCPYCSPSHWRAVSDFQIIQVSAPQVERMYHATREEQDNCGYCQRQQAHTAQAQMAQARVPQFQWQESGDGRNAPLAAPEVFFQPSESSFRNILRMVNGPQKAQSSNECRCQGCGGY